MPPSFEYQPSERRPIASRDTRWARAAAARLAAAGISANAISIAGMCSGMLAGAAFASTGWTTSSSMRFPADRAAWLAGAVLVQLRLLANLLDGMVAIASQRASRVGELYNEIPDRVSDSFNFIGLGFAAGGNAALGFLAALAAMFTAYVRAQAKAAGAPQDYCGPLAKPQRMFVVTLIALYCALAPQAWQPAWSGAGLPAAALAFILLGALVTAARRIVRAAAALQRSVP